MWVGGGERGEASTVCVLEEYRLKVNYQHILIVVDQSTFPCFRCVEHAALLCVCVGVFFFSYSISQDRTEFFLLLD